VSITLADARIHLAAEPARQIRPALEVAMPGHCPGPANWRWLLEQPQLVGLIEQAGYHDQLDALRKLDKLLKSGVGEGPSDDTDIASLTLLQNIPLPLDSLSHFNHLFPQAFTTGTLYRSQLAGNAAWLPLAVRDFFAGTRGNGPQRLWVIPVSEHAQQEGFLPSQDTVWEDNKLISAFDRALGLPDVGLIALPDLERLQVPADLPDIPRLRLPNQVPAFLPCSSEYDDMHRERRYSEEIPKAPAPRDFVNTLNALAGLIARRRPDMHLLLGMPFDPDGETESPRISPDDLNRLGNYRESARGHYLRRVQLTFPYLRSARHALKSPAGVLAAEMAKRSRQGSWLSVAGRPLGDEARPYPPINRNLATELRDTHAIGVFIEERGQLKLDDERLAAGVFNDSAEHARSGEIARFLGWLQRELRRLGEQLVFDVDPRDPRPRILLESFFGQLHARGALRGTMPGDAFTIRQMAPAGSTLLFEIELAPAFPIDRIRLSISRDGHDQGWQVGGLA